MRSEADKKYYINMDTKFSMELPGENREKGGKWYLLTSVKMLDSDVPCGRVLRSLRSLTYDSFDLKIKHTINSSCDPNDVAYKWRDKNHVWFFTGGKNMKNFI